MKKLGIIGAMSVEIETLKAKMSDVKISQYARITFFEGQLEKMHVVLAECGVGKVNAALCVQILVDIYRVTHLVNTGVAGSLCADLDIGDFVISEKAMYHDFDCHILNPAYPVGQVPGLPVHSFSADEMLIRLAAQAAEEVNAGHFRVGIVASGDQFVCSKEIKKQIVQDTGAICTEMEGAAIAHAAWKNEIPFVVIRAISDKADDSAQMDYPTFEAIAAVRCADVTCRLSAALAKEP